MLFVASSVKFINCINDQLLSDTIRPNTNEETQEQAALSVIRRLIGEKAEDIVIKINFNLTGHYFKVRNFAQRYRMNKLSPLISNDVRSHFVNSSGKRTTRRCFVLKRQTEFPPAKPFITISNIIARHIFPGMAINFHLSTNFRQHRSK